MEATEKVTWALVCLSPGLVAFSLVNILARAFYALGDTKTPMKISIFCLGVNLIFALTFVWKLRQGQDGFGEHDQRVFAICSLLFCCALRKKLGRLEFGALRKMLWPIFVAGIVAAVTAVFTARVGCGDWVSRDCAAIGRGVCADDGGDGGLLAGGAGVQGAASGGDGAVGLEEVGERKAPTSNIQAPVKLQFSSFN